VSGIELGEEEGVEEEKKKAEDVDEAFDAEDGAVDEDVLDMALEGGAELLKDADDALDELTAGLLGVREMVGMLEDTDGTDADVILDSAELEVGGTEVSGADVWTGTSTVTT